MRPGLEQHANRTGSCVEIVAESDSESECPGRISTIMLSFLSRQSICEWGLRSIGPAICEWGLPKSVSGKAGTLAGDDERGPAGSISPTRPAPGNHCSSRAASSSAPPTKFAETRVRRKASLEESPSEDGSPLQMTSHPSSGPRKRARSSGQESGRDEMRDLGSSGENGGGRRRLLYP